MAAKLFTCIQIEMPFTWEITAGSYALRNAPGNEPTHVLIVKQPPGANQRVLVVAAAGIADEQQARSWLAGAQPATDAEAAFAALNAAIFARRIAAADHTACALPPEHARSVLAGWGSGEQVAQAQLAESRPLGFAADHPTGRLRKQQRNPGSDSRANSLDRRFNALIDGSAPYLLCEELALRARQDLACGRLRLAAIELDRAYAAAVHELSELASADFGQNERGDGQAGMARGFEQQRGLRRRRPGLKSSGRLKAEQAAFSSLRLSERLAELKEQAGTVAAGAAAALKQDAADGSACEPLYSFASAPDQAPADAALTAQAQAIAHALERLEALLRAYALLSVAAQN